MALSLFFCLAVHVYQSMLPNFHPDNILVATSSTKTLTLIFVNPQRELAAHKPREASLQNQTQYMLYSGHLLHKPVDWMNVLWKNSARTVQFKFR